MQVGVKADCTDFWLPVLDRHHSQHSTCEIDKAQVYSAGFRSNWIPTNREDTWAMMAKWLHSLRRRLILVPIALLIGVGLVAAFPGRSWAGDAEPTPAPGPNSLGMGMMDPHERLARPPMSDPPTQIELGHAEYWMSCMVCHGDRGQGLTEEWRSGLDPAVVAKIKEALLALDINNPEHKAILEKSGFIGVIPAQYAYYDPVRRLAKII